MKKHTLLKRNLSFLTALAVLFSTALVSLFGLLPARTAKAISWPTGGSTPGWENGWIYQLQRPASMNTFDYIAPDTDGYITTSEDCPLLPSIFQISDDDADTYTTPRAVATPLNGFKMSFSFELGADETFFDYKPGTWSYHPHGQYLGPKANIPATLGYIMFVPKGGWYNNYSTSFGFMMQTFNGLVSTVDGGPSRLWIDQVTGGAAGAIDPVGNWTNMPFYFDGTPNIIEIQRSGSDYYIHINGEAFTTPINAAALSAFTTGKTYTQFYILNDALLTCLGTSAKIQIQDIGCTLDGISGTLNVGDTAAEIFDTNGDGGFSQYNLAAPAVDYESDTAGDPKFTSTAANQDFYIKKNEPVNIKGTEIEFKVNNGGSNAIFGTNEKLGVFFTDDTYDENDDSGKQLRLYFGRNGASTNTASLSAVYWNGSTETVIGSANVPFNYNETKNTLRLAYSADRTSVIINGTRVGLGNLDTNLGYMTFTADETLIAFKKVSAGSGGNETALTLAKFTLCPPDNTAISGVNYSSANAKSENNGIDDPVFFNDTAASETFTFGNKMLVDSFAMDYSVDRSLTTNVDDFTISLVNGKAGAAAAKISFIFTQNGGQTDVTVTAADGTGAPRTVLETDTTDFKWDGAANYLGFVYMYETNYKGYGLVLNKNNSSNPEMFTGAGDNAFIRDLQAKYEDSTAYIQVETGADPYTKFSKHGVNYYVKRGAAAPGWSIHSEQGMEFGYFSGEGQAAFASGEGKTSFTVKQTERVVSIMDFKFEFDYVGNDFGGGLILYIVPNGGMWYSDQPNGLGLSISPSTSYNDKAHVQIMHDVHVNVGANILTDFNWGGRNLLELKYESGVYSFYVNGNRLDDDGTTAGAVDAKIKEMAPAFVGTTGYVQLFNNSGDITIFLREIKNTTAINAPVAGDLIVDNIAKSYAAGKEITIDLTSYFRATNDPDTLTYTCDVGEISGSVWKYTPPADKAGEKVTVTITCTSMYGGTTKQIFDINVVAAGTETGGDDNNDNCKNCSKSNASSAGALMGVLGVAFIVIRRRKYGA